MGLLSGLPVGRLGRVSVDVALIEVGRMPLVGVQRQMIRPGVVDEYLVYS